MSEIDQGGFVYPNKYALEYQSGIAGGITLRQHYAGLAMQALISSNPRTVITKQIAVTAFLHADAMIEAGKP